MIWKHADQKDSYLKVGQEDIQCQDDIEDRRNEEEDGEGGWEGKKGGRRADGGEFWVGR